MPGDSSDTISMNKTGENNPAFWRWFGTPLAFFLAVYPWLTLLVRFVRIPPWTMPNPSPFDTFLWVGGNVMVGLLIHWLWFAPIWFVAFGSAVYKGLVKRRYWIPCSILSLAGIALACHMIIFLRFDREEVAPVFYVAFAALAAVVLLKIIQYFERRKN